MVSPIEPRPSASPLTSHSSPSRAPRPAPRLTALRNAARRLFQDFSHSHHPSRGTPSHRAIADQFALPADLLIRSHESFAKHRPNPNSMLSRLLEDAEVLYDRRAA